MSLKRGNSSKTGSAKVVALGLDAPNHELLEAWLDGGLLPNLGKLRRRGASSLITSTKHYSNEHCWIPFLTGTSLERWDHWLDRWDPATYTYDEESLYQWGTAPVFYALGDAFKVAAFDLSAPIANGVNGIQVVGWATDLNACFPASQPADLLGELIRDYGPDPKLAAAHPIWDRQHQNAGVSYTVPSAYDAGALRRFGAALARSAEMRGDICRDLIGRDDWDLFLALFSETHTGGHVLWHLSQPHPISGIRGTLDEDPLLAIFRAADSAIGKILEAADGAYVVVFSIDSVVVDCLENGRSLFLPEFLYRWCFPGMAALATGQVGTPVPPPRFDYARHWKHEVWDLRTAGADAELDSPERQERRRDPLSWCPANWYAPLWPRMRAFALPSVADGYVRLNIRGREARGEVDASDFGMTCEALTRDLGGLVDARTGAPMVREVVRVRQDPSDQDPTQHPADLIVIWREDRPVDTVDSPAVGRIGPVPYFRSGGHRCQHAEIRNLLMLAGPGIGPDLPLRPGRPEDVPATILALMGVDPPDHYDGHSLIDRSVLEQARR